MAVATAPQLGQPAIENARPEADDLRLWSVTTILKTLASEGLIYWAAEQAALAAVHSEATWRGMLADDDPGCDHSSAKRCQAVKWLRDARNRKPKGLLSSRELGDLVHKACESYALTGTKPTEIHPEVGPFLDRFDEWLGQHGPSYQATEVAVFNPALGYAGTADAFLTIDGVRFIADYKTSRDAEDSSGNPKTPYPDSVALQLSAYRHAPFAAVWRPRRTEIFRRRYYLFGPDEQALAVPVPEVDTGLCIFITPSSCEAYPIVCDEGVFERYLAVQDATRWVQQESRAVMGAPLMATRGAA